MRALPFLGLAVLTGCASVPEKVPLSARPTGPLLALPAPLGLPPVPVPAHNPPTAEGIALGEKLFFSKALSADGSVSCASCHDPKYGFADPRRVSVGAGGKTGKRNAPPVLNAAYNSLQFWDGRAKSLEEQAAGPMMNPLEMAHSIEGVEKRVAGDPELRRRFEATYGAAPAGQSPVTLDRIQSAIASYERTLVRGNSAFDRYQYGGDRKALSPAAVRGLAVFQDKAKGNCAVCHTIEAQYALFTDNKFHNIGVGVNAEGELTDLGRYEVTRQEADKGAFRTPSLREIASTAPYMHDGSLKTLKDVVDFYVGGGSANPQLDKEIKALSHLSRQEREDLVSFLESLTGVVAQ